jgi:hypothetical protein
MGFETTYDSGRYKVVRKDAVVLDGLDWDYTLEQLRKAQAPGNVATFQLLVRAIEDQTKPEPTGLGAVVEGREGNRWVRTNETKSFPWRKSGSTDRVSSWAGITTTYGPVSVLSNGV